MRTLPLLLLLPMVGCGGSSPSSPDAALIDGDGAPDDGPGADADPDAGTDAPVDARVIDAAPVPLTCAGGVEIARGPDLISALDADANDVYWIETDRATHWRLRRLFLFGGAPQTLLTSNTAIGPITLDGENLYWVDGHTIRRRARTSGALTTIYSDPAAAPPAGLTSDETNVYFANRNALVFVPASAAGPTAATEICHIAAGAIGSLVVDATSATFIHDTGVYTVPLTVRGAVCGAPPSSSVTEHGMVLDGASVIMAGKSTLFADHTGVFRAPRGGGAAGQLYDNDVDPTRDPVRIVDDLFWIVDTPGDEHVARGHVDGSGNVGRVVGSLAPMTLVSGGALLFYGEFDDAGPLGILCRIQP